MAYPNQLVNQQLQGGGQLAQLPLYSSGNQGGIEDILGQLRGMGIQGLQNPTQGFDPIEKSARRGFEQDTIPLLAQRAASLGSTNSSGYRNSLTRAGTNFDLGLNAQRAQFGQQNIGQLLQMLQLGLKPSTENIFSPQGQGFGSSIAGGLGAGLGTAGSLYGASQLGLLGGSAAAPLAAGATAAGTTAGAGAGAGAGGALATGGLAALAAQPWFWPVLAALAVGGGAYGLSQLSGD